jgi:hypothetical protein
MWNRNASAGTPKNRRALDAAVVLPLAAPASQLRAVAQSP